MVWSIYQFNFIIRLIRLIRIQTEDEFLNKANSWTKRQFREYELIKRVIAI